MIVSWMLHSTATASLLGGAAVAAEHCLRLHGRPGRGVWVIAFATCVSFPLIALAVAEVLPTLQTVSQPGDVSVELAETVWTLPSRAVVSAETHLALFETAALILGIAASITLLSILGWSFTRLRGELRSCRPSRVSGIPVLISSSFGPAVVGLARQTIVSPAWVFRCNERTKTLIAKHELEHIRARDQYLLAVASFFGLLLPWNLVLWWYSTRLRLAVESDCDMRLLRNGASVRDYGRLLLEVGSRLGRAPLTALAFSRSRSSLFRRIQLMTCTPRKRAAKTSAAMVAALALILLACEMPLPFENATDSPRTMAVTASAEQGPDSIMVFIQEAPEPEVAGADDYMRRMRPAAYIDGVRISEPIEVVIDTLSPDRIDRIEVVKADAARAQYGERAANGVIHIYLKTIIGQEGDDSPEG